MKHKYKFNTKRLAGLLGLSPLVAFLIYKKLLDSKQTICYTVYTVKA